MRKSYYLLLSPILLSVACVPKNESSPYYQSYSHSYYSSQSEASYYSNWDGASNYNETYSESKPVEVPESYHLGAYRSPPSARENDKTWVSKQNPEHYTVEIADDEKAALVAKKLNQAPKQNTTAEVPYQREGKAYYKGLNGSYQTAEEAQKSLDSLPPELKAGAKIKTWNSIQPNMQ